MIKSNNKDALDSRALIIVQKQSKTKNKRCNKIDPRTISKNGRISTRRLDLSIVSCGRRFRCAFSSSLKKQPARPTSSFPAKRSLKNERRKSILLPHHYTDLGSASDLGK